MNGQKKRSAARRKKPLFDKLASGKPITKGDMVRDFIEYMLGTNLGTKKNRKKLKP